VLVFERLLKTLRLQKFPSPVEEVLDKMDAADNINALVEMKDLRAYLLSPRVKKLVGSMFSLLSFVFRISTIE